MNKALTIIAAILTALTISACAKAERNTNAEITAPAATSDPQPTETPTSDPIPQEEISESFESEVETGGDLSDAIYATTNPKLNYISMSFVNLAGVDKFEEWLYSSSSSLSEYTSVAEAANLYSFIKHFEIPEDKVREILTFERGGNEDEDFSDEDIEILISGDSETIAKHFAADTAICKGENLYSIYWMQNHTAQDYLEAGITAEDINAILPRYEALGLNPGALDEVNAKLADILETE